MPERMAAFLAQHQRYDRLLRQLHLSDAAVEELAANRHVGTARTFALGAVALLVFPVAFVGWLHWRLPMKLAEKLSLRFTDPKKRKAQTAHAHMLAGLVACGAFYAGYFFLAKAWVGLPAAGWYAFGLPVTGLIGHYYFAEIRRLAAAVRTAAILLRAPLARRRVLRLRTALIREIEALRKIYRQTLPSARGGAA